MKKTFLLFTIFFINIIYSQKIDCRTCSGNGKVTQRDWITCSNCKDWSSSYKSKVPCNVCKDNRGHYTAYYNTVCYKCDGSGHDYDAEKLTKYQNSEEGKRNAKELLDKFHKDIADRQKESNEKEYEYSDLMWQYSFTPTANNDEIIRILLKAHKVSGIDTWNFDSMDEFKKVDIYSKKILGSGELKLKVYLDLEGSSGNKYKGDITFIFIFHKVNATEGKWNFREIKEGKVEKDTSNKADRISKEKANNHAEYNANRNPVFVDLVKYATKELTKSKYEFNFKKPLTIDFINTVISDRDKLFIGISKLKTIDQIKVKCKECDEYFSYDGSGGYSNGTYSIKISGDGGTISLDKMDGERFQNAIDFFKNLVRELENFGQ